MAAMAKTNFTHAQRYAIFTAHSEKCWLCREPVSLAEMEVDHVIPESLAKHAALKDILKLMGLPEDFNLNSYANLLPAHRDCNRDKGAYRFKPTPMFIRILDQGLEKAKHVQKLHDTFLSTRKLNTAFSRILAAIEEGKLSPEQMKELAAAAAIEHEPQREPEMHGQPLFLSPGLRVVGEDEHFHYLKGLSGMTGYRPKGNNIDISFDCPNCGPTGWNGTRCIQCGMLIDPD
ncbi:HNH endonuclease signature motif containing protein [Mesorhizobium ciceri]|uniref:HNH endonuclease signature motif containing protein n=2 Tax=Mesorhizobium ciceri TaxID=39645 RepID=UPI001374772E